MSYGIEDKARARQLFVEDGVTFDEVGEETGVSVSQLKKWGGEGKWVEAQKEFERQYLQLTTDVHKLKLNTVQRALKSGHSQDIFAATRLLQVMPTGRKARRETDEAGRFIKWMSGLIDYLKQRDADALRHLEPHIRGFADSVKEAG